MSDENQFSYDTVSYRGGVFPQTHPDRLCTLGSLYGLNPAPVENCRVLELGCGDGINLISMAFGLPSSSFVGIDLAETAIAAAQETVDSLEMKNITFRQMDVMDLDAEFGDFDYIIAHGLYAWVPGVVQEKILSIIKNHLAKDGVAYVSYNTYPACHLRQMFRDMMLYHVSELDDPEARTQQARALLLFLAQSQINSGFYRDLLNQEVERVSTIEDGFLFHDDLAEVNQPLYFHQFIEQASRHGLQYLAEANFHDASDGVFDSSVSEKLDLVSQGSTVIREQYKDFLRFRSFRRTLLSHSENDVRRSYGPEQMHSLYAASSARARIADSNESVVQFDVDKRGSFSTENLATIAAMECLNKEWPGYLHFDELVEQTRDLVRRKHGESAAESCDAELVVSHLMAVASPTGFVELHSHRPQLVVTPGEQPLASELGRFQARNGSPVSNQLQNAILLGDPLTNEFLGLLDGTRTREDLKKGTAELIRSGIEVKAADDESQDDARARILNSLDEVVNECLQTLARLGLLIR